MNRIRISIAPQLREVVGPAIDWVWRQALTTLGYAWQETAPGEPCDVAYVVDCERQPLAQVVIVASPERWHLPSRYRLRSLIPDKLFPMPCFDGESLHQMALERRENTLWSYRDLLFDLFWFLTGQEERTWPQDIHGFYTLPEAWLASQVLEQAPVSAMLEGLGALLQQAGAGESLPRWPDGKRAAAAITHDVDYPEVIRWLEPWRILRRQGLQGVWPAWEVLIGRRNHWAFPDWMKFEDRYGVRSAFYFVARQGSLLEYGRGLPDPFYDVTSPRFRALFRTLIEGGWEVGMHASYLAYASPERFAAEKRRLEEAAAAPILGNRHHYWHLNPADPEETLQLHAHLGFLYDTSLMHDRHLGWRRGTVTPFFPLAQKTGCEIGVVQLPVAWMDAQLMQRKELTQAQREAIIVALVDRTATLGGLFVANVHDYVFDEKLFPGWLAVLRAALDRIAERGDFWFATPAAIALHWRERYERLLKISAGLDEGR